MSSTAIDVARMQLNKSSIKLNKFGPERFIQYCPHLIMKKKFGFMRNKNSIIGLIPVVILSMFTVKYNWLFATKDKDCRSCIKSWILRLGESFFQNSSHYYGTWTCHSYANHRFHLRADGIKWWKYSVLYHPALRKIILLKSLE